MERGRLLGILSGGDAEVVAACRESLLAGANYEVWEGSVPASRLAAIYARRERLARRRGQVTFGGPVTIAWLDAAGETPVRLGRVWTSDHWFVLFFDHRGHELVGCIGGSRAIPLSEE